MKKKFNSYKSITKKKKKKENKKKIPSIYQLVRSIVLIC